MLYLVKTFNKTAVTSVKDQGRKRQIWLHKGIDIQSPSRGNQAHQKWHYCSKQGTPDKLKGTYQPVSNHKHM